MVDIVKINIQNIFKIKYSNKKTNKKQIKSVDKNKTE